GRWWGWGVGERHRDEGRVRARQTALWLASGDHRAQRTRAGACSERGGTTRRCRAVLGLACLCDQSYRRGDELGPRRGGLSQRVSDRTRLRAVERACFVADTVVFAVRPPGCWTALPVEHRAARFSLDAIRCAAQSAASRRAAQRHLSRSTGTADGTADDGDDAVGFSRGDAVAYKDRGPTP